MLERISDPKRVRLAEGHIPIRHRYTPGVAGTAFFEALRSGDFLAARCDDCGITYCPNRIFCERCFAALEADTKVGPRGTLESFTVAHRDVEGRPLDEPVTLGLVRLDGADTVLLHRVLDVAAALEIGMTVEPVFEPKTKRTGAITDVRGFRAATRRR
jgi:uncharacterized OB-fold protein